MTKIILSTLYNLIIKRYFVYTIVVCFVKRLKLSRMTISFIFWN